MEPQFTEEEVKTLKEMAEYWIRKKKSAEWRRKHKERQAKEFVCKDCGGIKVTSYALDTLRRDMGLKHCKCESSIQINTKKGKNVAEHLFRCFSTIGIHGKTEMPEDIIPKDVQRGSLEHLLFITLTCSIDYQRDAPALWESSRKTYEDPETKYLFDPKSLYEAPSDKIITDMQKHGLSKKPKNDAEIWQTISVTFLKKWKGDPRNFLESCNWDSLKILEHLNNDTHMYNGRIMNDFRNLRGLKIGPLWLRMLRDNVGIQNLKKLEKVPIPVDIHIARATLATGIVKGRFSGRLNELFEHIREAWFKSVEGLPARDKPMIALDIDEPLWHLSKYGCTKRNKETGYCPVNNCEAKDFCIQGKIKIDKDRSSVVLST